jgi:hypothetical protein
MKKGLVAVALTVLVAGVAIWFYQDQPVKVTSRVMTVCEDLGHKGDRVIKTTDVVVTVPRKAVRSVLQKEERIVCQACRDRREREARAAEQRRRREAAEAQKRTEAEEAFRNLRAEFTFGMGGTEESIEPGGEISLKVVIHNLGGQPVSGLHIVIGPREYLSLEPDERNHSGYTDERKYARAADEERSRLLKRITTNGVLILAWQGGKDQIPPENSPYYRANPGEWQSMGGTGLGFGAQNRDSFYHYLILSRNLSPGQDVRLNGYLVIKGVKQQIGTLVVHVKYPQ